MLLHASCAARDGHGVLVTGAPGSGKSDLILRLLAHGFALVADDQVELDGLDASAPPRLAGLLEVRGLGITRVPHVARATVKLVVALGAPERLPTPQRHAAGIPMITLDAALASAPIRVSWALDCALGHRSQLAGAFA